MRTNQTNATTRRHFIGGLAAAGTAFAIPARMFAEEASASPHSVAPLKGHFHPKGKAPSKFTVDILKQAKSKLPFSDTRGNQVLHFANQGMTRWGNARIQEVLRADRDLYAHMNTTGAHTETPREM